MKTIFGILAGILAAKTADALFVHIEQRRRDARYDPYVRAHEFC